jgi:hypothetical protein|tara:strand:+ start:930 stop:1166 length:237 start_codon:yes stop_codon:yes gene_type:complete
MNERIQELSEEAWRQIDVGKIRAAVADANANAAANASPDVYGVWDGATTDDLFFAGRALYYSNKLKEKQNERTISTTC